VSSPICIRTEHLVYSYGDRILALDSVDVQIRENAYLAIVGQNGSGKTTLVKHFNGLLRPSAGRVWVDGIDTATVSVGRLARTVGYVFQNPDHQIYCASTREEISFGPRNLGLSAAQVRARTDEALAAFDLADHADVPPALLGFGLRRKVAIASVYAMRPRILILDEATAGLDWRSVRELMSRIDQLHASGHTIIFITHDMRVAAQYAREVLVMQGGRILVHGPTREVFSHADNLRKAQIAPPQVAQLAQRLADRGIPGDILTVCAFCEAYSRLKGPPR